ASVAQYTEQALARGYRHVKVHEIEAVNVKAARDALGPDIPLMVDCNCLWDVEEAVRRARSFMPYHPHWIEEAIWPPEDGHAMAELRRQGGVPTAAGENYMFDDFQRLCELESLDFLQPSITKVGGASGMRDPSPVGERTRLQFDGYDWRLVKVRAKRGVPRPTSLTSILPPPRRRPAWPSRGAHLRRRTHRPRWSRAEAGPDLASRQAGTCCP